jgi:hypothetical protein
VSPITLSSGSFSCCIIDLESIVAPSAIGFSLDSLIP